MRDEYHSELNKITRVSSILLPLLYLSLLSFAAVLVVVPWITLTSPTATGEPVLSRFWDTYVEPQDIRAGLLTLRDKVQLLVSILLYSAFALPALWYTIRLIHCFRNHALFSAPAVDHARKVAILFLLFTCVKVVSALYLAWTPEGFDFVFNPYFFSIEYILLGLMWLFVWMLQIGRVLHLDSEMTI